MAPREWFPCDARIGQDPKVASLPSDSARWAWVLVLASAKQQRPEGEWKTLEHVRAALPHRYGKFVDEMLRVGLLHVEDDATVTVPAWRKWAHRTWVDRSSERVVDFRKRERAKP